MRGCGFGGSIVGSARGRGFQDIECESEALKCAVIGLEGFVLEVRRKKYLVESGWNGGLSGWQILERSR